MALFVDSAIADEVREAMSWGFVAGVTTNPSLMALVRRPAEEVIEELCRLTSGPVFYQVTKSDPQECEAEARRFASISPGQIVLKIPCTLNGLTVAARLSPRIPCAATAVFSPAQTFLAVEAGVRYVIPYVNRATRLTGDGLALVRSMADVAACSGRGAEVLAASLKTPDEVAGALLSGAHHVTIPLAVIKMMAGHEHTLAAMEEFARAKPR